MVQPRKITISTLRDLKRRKSRIRMVTCYDFAVASMVAETPIESILVGDTYGEVCLGQPNTLGVTVDLLIPITEAVRRGAPLVYLVGDMPYLSYQADGKEAVHNAGRFMAQAGCDCVKVEVDRRLAKTVEAMATATIPVMAHLGLLPQSVHRMGGYRTQGRLANDAARMIEDARIMEESGAVALLLEAVPTEVAGIISENTELPVIGIASGSRCDGQVTVLHDMMGLGVGHPPRAARRFAELREKFIEAFHAFSNEVQAGAFPSDEQSTAMHPSELEDLRRLLDLPGGSSSSNWRSAGPAASSEGELTRS